MIPEPVILVADECWLALAMLHRSLPDRESFSAREIMEKLRTEHIHHDLRPGLQPHIHLHNVANLNPNSAKYRMFYRLEDGTLRLFKPGDSTHPARKGKSCPKRKDLPKRYHLLIDWYEKEYCNGSIGGDPSSAANLILEMRGVGKEIWPEGGGDAFVEAQRSGWANEEKPKEERVWERLRAHQREKFFTKKKVPFTYKMTREGGIWFYHGNGARIEMFLGRGQLNEAIVRRAQGPLERVADLGDLRDPSYLFGLLTDPRIWDIN
jgi:hypothetical protein